MTRKQLLLYSLATLAVFTLTALIDYLITGWQ